MEPVRKKTSLFNSKRIGLIMVLIQGPYSLLLLVFYTKVSVFGVYIYMYMYIYIYIKIYIYIYIYMV